jgi:UrcA family protein
MKIHFAIAALATALAGAPVLAQGHGATATFVVRTADLDLASSAGRRALDRRIGNAVRDACGTASDVDLHGRNALQACRTETRHAAQAQRSAAVAPALPPAGDRLASGR